MYTDHETKSQTQRFKSY